MIHNFCEYFILKVRHFDPTDSTGNHKDIKIRYQNSSPVCILNYIIFTAETGVDIKVQKTGILKTLYFKQRSRKSPYTMRTYSVDIERF